MVTVTHEIAEKVKCIVCGKEKYALNAPYVCHGCWKNGEAALMIQRLTPRAPDLGWTCECEAVNWQALQSCGICGKPRPSG